MVQKVMLASLGVILVLAVVLIAATGERDPAIGLTSGPSGGSGEFVPKGTPDSRAIVWDNGMGYSALGTAQIDAAVPFESEPADDFMFDVDQSVNDVHWIGGYWNGPPEDGDFDWKVSFYADFGDGTKPGALIASWVFPNADVNETLIETMFYSYSVDLPATLNFLAGTKYWIAIQGIGNYPPQSGWATHQDVILLHECTFRSVYFGYPDWVNGSVLWDEPTDLCFQLTYEVEECDWQPGDPYKHHFPQLPDEEGWAVNATQPMVLAEDFMCMDTGWIKDFHFWGAWKNEDVGLVTTFVLSIHADIPADPPLVPYSRPGDALWEFYAEEFDYTPIDPPTTEGWYDPATGEVIPDDHTAYWQYNICLPEPNWFWQDSSTIYWVNISAIVADPLTTTWGWKSTQDHWNDDAVWAYWDELDWIDIWEPTDPQMNIFWIALDPSGMIIPSLTGGTGYYPPGDVNGWWLYEGPEWEFWNIWFYDHPFTYDRTKTVHIDFDIVELEPGAGSWITFVVNYSTDLWSLEGQPPGDSMPPLPGLPPDLELLYIGRDTLYDGPVVEGHYIYDWEMADYNPEWISIDVWGYNFVIPEGMGMVYHDCIGSLDLSLVVTSGEPADSGACCYPEPTGGDNVLCTYTTESYCVTTLGGVYEGDGTVCAGMQACCLADGSCVDADSLCCVNELSGTPQGPGTSCTVLEACCFSDGSCQNLDPLCCVDQGGVPQGPGTACTVLEACCMPNGSCQMLDPECCDDQGGVRQGVGTICTTPVACCFPDSTCQNLDSLCCMDQGGSPSPIGDTCLGDIDPANGIDDACEEPCCNDDGIRGDADYNGGAPNVGDVSYLVDYLFGTPAGPAPPCFEEGDVDASGAINVGDLSWLVDYLFGDPVGLPPQPCP